MIYHHFRDHLSTLVRMLFDEDDDDFPSTFKWLGTPLEFRRSGGGNRRGVSNESMAADDRVDTAAAPRALPTRSTRHPLSRSPPRAPPSPPHSSASLLPLSSQLSTSWSSSLYSTSCGKGKEKRKLTERGRALDELDSEAEVDDLRPTVTPPHPPSPSQPSSTPAATGSWRSPATDVEWKWECGSDLYHTLFLFRMIVLQVADIYQHLPGLIFSCQFLLRILLLK